MPHLIVEKLDGVAAKQIAEKQQNQADDLQYQIFGNSVFGRYYEGSKGFQSKATDDKAVIGVSSQGLPFMILVDGFANGETQKTFKFIDEHVTPLVAETADELSQTDNVTEVISVLINKIYDLRKKYAIYCEFTMSLAITYQKDDRTYCAGFGIGDIGLVLRNVDGSCQQLTYSTKVDNVKDGFDTFAQDNFVREKIIERNSLFNVEVQPGAEIFGYTFVFEELQTLVSAESIDDKTVEKYALLVDQLPKEDTLFSYVQPTTIKAFHSKRLAAKTDKPESVVFGDDFMVASVLIPSEEVRQQLAAKVSASAAASNGSSCSSNPVYGNGGVRPTLHGQLPNSLRQQPVCDVKCTIS